jgi:hypothetical protein
MGGIISIPKFVAMDIVTIITSIGISLAGMVAWIANIIIMYAKIILFVVQSFKCLEDIEVIHNH